MVFGLHGFVCALLAYPGMSRNWEIYTDLVKTLLLALLMPALVTSRARAHVLVLAIAMSAGFYGLGEGLKFLKSGGSHISQGVGNLGDRNHFAVAVTMVLPLILYLVWYSKQKWARLAALAGLFINVLAVISSQSRGGLLALIGVALMLVLRSKRKFTGLLLVCAVGFTVVQLAPADWFNRMNTIKEAAEDGSFMGRVIAWKRASAIALNHPLVGGGYRSVQDPGVYEKFRLEQGFMGFIDTPPSHYAAAAHSIYFEVMSDTGLLGLFLFLGIMVSPLLVLGKVNRMCTQIGPHYQWAADLMTMLNLGIVAFLVGGASISAAYFELAYVLVALSFVVMNLVREEHIALRKQGVLDMRGRRVMPPAAAMAPASASSGR